jgi:hypothetical protein
MVRFGPELRFKVPLKDTCDDIIRRWVIPIATRSRPFYFDLKSHKLTWMMTWNNHLPPTIVTARFAVDLGGYPAPQFFYRMLAASGRAHSLCQNAAFDCSMAVSGTK